MPLDDLTLARLFLDHVRSHAVIALEMDGTITGWAAGAEAITGYSRDEMLGHNMRELFTEVDQAAQMPEVEIATALEQGRRRTAAGTRGGMAPCSGPTGRPCTSASRRRW